MIPDIGLMIGFYIIARMISFLTRQDPRAESITVKIFAVITILVAVVCMMDLVMHGTTPMPGGV